MNLMSVDLFYNEKKILILICLEIYFDCIVILFRDIILFY